MTPSLKTKKYVLIGPIYLGISIPEKKRIIFIGALEYMHIFVVMFEMYMSCVSSDISHTNYILYYKSLGFLDLLDFKINYSTFNRHQKG